MVVVVVEEEEEYRDLKFYRIHFSVAIAQLNNNDKNYHYYNTTINAQIFKNTDVENKLKRLLLINDQEGRVTFSLIRCNEAP